MERNVCIKDKAFVEEMQRESEEYFGIGVEKKKQGILGVRVDNLQFN